MTEWVLVLSVLFSNLECPEGCRGVYDHLVGILKSVGVDCTEIGKMAWLFVKLQPGRARKRINAT